MALVCPQGLLESERLAKIPALQSEVLYGVWLHIHVYTVLKHIRFKALQDLRCLTSMLVYVLRVIQF